MSEIQDLTQKILEFRDQRDWKQFHNPKDLAITLALEAAEVLEHFQWKTPAEIEEYARTAREEIGEELADVFNLLLLLAQELDINLYDATVRKIEKNGRKYPVEKARGKHLKYNQL